MFVNYYQSVKVIQELDSKQRKIRSLRGFFIEFLFGYTEVINSTYQSSSPGLDAKIQTLQNQVDSLQQKIIQLESKLENPKYALSESSQPLKSSKTIQQDDYTFEVEKGPNDQNFIILSKIPEEERVEIIKLDFQLNQEGKISLKKYYESKDTNSLFQIHGYCLKYESIRRTSIYKSLKE